ncbi:MAG: fibronectin type III domain-containing protein [Nitrososphaeria archaeon]
MKNYSKKIVIELVTILLIGIFFSGIPTVKAANLTLSSPAQTETTITLQWTESNDFLFSSYTLYMANNVNGPWTAIWSTNSISQTSTFVYNLYPNTNYYFYILDDGTTTKTPSNTLQVSTTSNPTLSIISVGETTVSLSWTDYNTYSSLVPFDSYTIQMSTSGGVWTTLTTITSVYDTTYTVTGLSAGTSYSFRVYDMVGQPGYEQISYSNTNSVTTVKTLTVSISASINTISVGQSTTLIASTNNGGVAPYTYQWYVNGNSVNGATSSTYTFNPSNSGSYNIYVSVTDSLGTTVNSNTLTITVTVKNTSIISPSGSILIPIIIIILVIIAVLGVVIVMKRGKKKQGPKQWQEPTKEKPEEEKK